MSVNFGNGGAVFSGPHVDSQTGSIFAATRSVVLVGDRVVLASRIGMRKVEGAQVPASVYSVVSLDLGTGVVKASREFLAFASLELFATDDEHIILAGRKVYRLTADLKDETILDYESTGHKLGSIENGSPDGKTLGNATSPGFDLLDTHSLGSTLLTKAPSYATSVNDHGFVTDNVHWTGQFPKDMGFVTYYDSTGDHLLYHGKCGGRPQFLTNDLILEPGCKQPIILDTHGAIIRTIDVSGYFSFAGVARNGSRFALQLGSGAKERFVVYTVETGKAISEVKADVAPEEQSWTAFSADGSLFIVGSPLKITLYRLP